MDAIWNKKSAELHALTFYHLGQAENVWSHLIQFWAEIFFSSILKVSSYLIYICLFPLATQKGPTVRFSDCGPCAHLFMDKLHRHRWKARYSSNQKPVPCKWPQLCNFCRQLSATFLPLKSPTAFSGRWKLSINTTFVKYDPTATKYINSTKKKHY